MEKKQIMIAGALLIVIAGVVVFLFRDDNSEPSVNLAPSLVVENIDSSFIEDFLFDSKEALLDASVPQEEATELEIENALVDFDTRYSNDEEGAYLYIIDLAQEKTLLNANNPSLVGGDINNQIIDEESTSALLEDIKFEEDEYDTVIHLEYDTEDGSVMTTSILKYGDLILGAGRYEKPETSDDEEDDEEETNEENTESTSDESEVEESEEA